MHPSCLGEQGGILWEQPPIPTKAEPDFSGMPTHAFLPHTVHLHPPPPFHNVGLGVKVIPVPFFLLQEDSLTQVHDTLWAAETTQEGCAGARAPLSGEEMV